MLPPRVVEAQKFVLKDAEGNVRGWMGTIGKGSELILGNVNAQTMIRLIVSTDSSDLHLFGSRKSGMNLGPESATPDISMIGVDGNGGAKITFKEFGPSFALEDANGSSIIVGATQLEKSANRRTNLPSAASIECALATRQQVGIHETGWFQFQPLWEMITREQPDLLG